jgi:hypothetical protein
MFEFDYFLYLLSFPIGPIRLSSIVLPIIQYVSLVQLNIPNEAPPGLNGQARRPHDHIQVIRDASSEIRLAQMISAL